MGKYIRGIDVASWEPNIDWQKVCAQDIHFAFIKASQADFTDALFDTHWANAKQAGILRGAYHFLDPKVNAKVQADTYLNKVSFESGDLPPVLDLEELHVPVPVETKGSKGSKGGKGSKGAKPKLIPSSQIVACAAEWLTRVEEATGMTPIIYSGPFYLRDRVCGPNGAPPSWAMKYPLWLANYLDHEVTENDLPMQPKGWSEWKFWQYSEDGMIDGIWNKEGNQLTEVDLNFFRGTLDDLRAMTHTGSIGGKEIVRPVRDDKDDKKEQPVEEKKEIPSKPDVPQGNFVKHVVKPGDTLLGIALKYKTTMNAILQINPQITNPNLIRDGETLNIPPKK